MHVVARDLCPRPMLALNRCSLGVNLSNVFASSFYAVVFVLFRLQVAVVKLSPFLLAVAAMTHPTLVQSVPTENHVAVVEYNYFMDGRHTGCLYLKGGQRRQCNWFSKTTRLFSSWHGEWYMHPEGMFARFDYRGISSAKWTATNRIGIGNDYLGRQIVMTKARHWLLDTVTMTYLEPPVEDGKEEEEEEEAEEEESDSEWVRVGPPMCRHGQHPLRCTLCAFDRHFPPH